MPRRRAGAEVPPRSAKQSDAQPRQRSPARVRWVATKDDAFTFIGSAQFSSKAGQLRYDAAASTLSGDVNGDGIADFSLKLVLLGTLDSSDFIL
jgi:hypothetical protein